MWDLMDCICCTRRLTARFLTLQGSLEIFTGLGLILGPPIGGWFYQAFGYEVPFLILGCLLMLMVPFNLYILPSIGRIWAFPSRHLHAH